MVQSGIFKSTLCINTQQFRFLIFLSVPSGLFPFVFCERTQLVGYFGGTSSDAIVPKKRGAPVTRYQGKKWPDQIFLHGYFFRKILHVPSIPCGLKVIHYWAKKKI
jgi:hypothetical protein